MGVNIRCETGGGKCGVARVGVGGDAVVVHWWLMVFAVVGVEGNGISCYGVKGGSEVGVVE